MGGDKDKDAGLMGEGGLRLSYDELFGRYYRVLVYFAYRLIKDHSQSEDIVQETFLRLYEKPVDLRRGEALDTYLFSAVKNRCFDFLKHRRTEQNYRSGYLPLPSEEYITASIVEAEALSMLEACVQRLPTECRKVMTMTMKGMSSPEISQQLNVAQSTVRAQKVRGIKLLRDLLPDELKMLILLFFSI